MNSFGTKFRISIFGESHGKSIGVVIDGVEAGIALSIEDFTLDLNRRRAGAEGTTKRVESDIPKILSGVYNDCTTGAPLTIIFKNENCSSKDYSQFEEKPRPGHSDLVSSIKYNFFNDLRGGGHFSGRLTLALVAAGVVAKKMVNPIEIEAKILEIGGEKEWQEVVNSAKLDGDSLGGIIGCCATNMDIGLGEPFFNSLESQIAHLALSIPGIRGIEFGDGFKAAKMRGSQHNDCYIDNDGTTQTNGCGGINGGISNGNPLIFRVAAKPTSSILKPQQTFNFVKDAPEELIIDGRHDVSFAIRLPVIIEAITAIVLADAKSIK